MTTSLTVDQAMNANPVPPVAGSHVFDRFLVNQVTFDPDTPVKFTRSSCVPSVIYSLPDVFVGTEKSVASVSVVDRGSASCVSLPDSKFAAMTIK